MAGLLKIGRITIVAKISVADYDPNSHLYELNQSASVSIRDSVAESGSAKLTGDAMRLYTFAFCTLVALLAATSASASETSPVGKWMTFTDDNKPQSYIEISENNGVLSGKVIEILHSEKGPNPVCEECEGERHNQPITGMTIIQDFRKSGDDLWEGGTIVKPANGKVYKCKMHLIDGGKKLEVRGFIGFAFLGETHVWNRVEP